MVSKRNWRRPRHDVCRKSRYLLYQWVPYAFLQGKAFFCCLLPRRHDTKWRNEFTLFFSTSLTCFQNTNTHLPLQKLDSPFSTSQMRSNLHSCFFSSTSSLSICLWVRLFTRLQIDISVAISDHWNYSMFERKILNILINRKWLGMENSDQN